ncbi:hypothetical protein K457DRAFT_169337 [Linnemannia elongata AG-77]|uniref:GATA-type domain-containing protein n=1 Tax=Linnemannia elongata AG-77 TaxID=1314771 RepID=A0A197KIV0_9FUNG|nr:hypothetical protein K457DRAFT_169337 [Linnemannia elongata AG-77]
MASFRPDSSEPLQQQQHTQHHQQQQQQQQQQQESIDMQSSKRHSSTSQNKMVVTTLDGEEEEIEVIGSGISSSFQPASERRPRLPLKLPNLNYNAPEPTVYNYSPGTSVIFNPYRGHGKLLTQSYAASSDNESGHPPEHTYQRLPGSQSQEWSQNPYSQHSHPQPLPPSHPYDSDGYPSYHQQQHYPDYPSYRTPHDHPYPPYPSNGHDPRDPRDYRDSRDFPHPREAREPYESEFDSTHSRPRPSSPRIGSSAKPDDQEGRGRMDHYPPPLPRDSRVAQPPPMPHRLRSPHNAIDPPHPKNAHSPYDDPGSSRYHPFPSQQRSPADPWESSSEHRPRYPSAAIDIPQPPHRRSVNTPSDYRRHEPLDNARSQHHNSYPQQSPSSSAAGPSSYRDPFNPPRGEGPRYEFNRINYRMIFEYASEIRDCLIKGKVGSTDRLLHNAEILSKIFMGCRVDQEPIDHVEEELALNPHQLRCTSCNIVKTPEWRKGPLGKPYYSRWVYIDAWRCDMLSYLGLNP